MKIGRFGLFAAVMLLAAFTPRGVTFAQNAVPATVLADLRAAAALAQQDEARVTRMSATTRDPLLANRMRDEGHRQSATTFSYVVNLAIADNPAAVQEIVSAAISVAPDLREAIVQSAVTAFPGFRNQILAARPGKYKSPQTAFASDSGASALLPAASAPATHEYAHPPARQVQENTIWDPLQPVNRPLFAIYQFIDDILIRPIAAGYGWLTPGPIKSGVRNAFRNLDSPIVFANDLLQLQPAEAATTLGRFVINSTIGGLGFFDVAARAGLVGHPADFDQTLNYYRVPAGPYIILPVLGPGTLRHNLARLVDNAADPLNYFDEVNRSVKIGRRVGNLIATRENLIEPLDTLRKDSLDWYATFRAAYYQDRGVVYRKGETAPSSAQNDLFDQAE